jgi:hypothetical protein
LVLKQRFLESKAKRAAKKTDKKDSTSSLHTVSTKHVQSNGGTSWPHSKILPPPHNCGPLTAGNKGDCCSPVLCGRPDVMIETFRVC